MGESEEVRSEDMAEDKKYYWLKLKRDFFKRHDIRIIEEMPNGKDYILFYLKLLLESVDHEGELRFSDTIPYNEQMLSVITNTNIDIVRSAMRVFSELKMVELFDDQTIYMTEVQKLVGSESTAAERMRKHREKRKALQCNNVQNCYTEIEKDKELKKELNSETIHIAESPAETAVNPAENVVYVAKLPLVDGSEFGVTEGDVNGWAVAYPAVNVVQELYKMRAWLDANPKNKKTARGIKRFVVNWLSREQNKAPRVQQYNGNQSTTGNPFLEMLDEMRENG